MGNRSLEEQEAYNDLEKQVNDICSTQSKSCSDVCRQVVFALFAVVGAFSLHDGTFAPGGAFLVALAFLILYLILDIGRYFYTMAAFNGFFNIINDAPEEGGFQKCNEKLRSKSVCINCISRRLFVLQVLLCLPAAFIALVVGIILRMV